VRERLEESLNLRGIAAGEFFAHRFNFAAVAVEDVVQLRPEWLDQSEFSPGVPDLVCGCREEMPGAPHAVSTKRTNRVALLVSEAQLDERGVEFQTSVFEASRCVSKILSSSHLRSILGGTRWAQRSPRTRL
jgi:hypothetical protein